MIDDIIIEKCWEDEDYFEILVMCKNSQVTAKSRVYVNDELIKELSQEINSFSTFKSDSVKWTSGTRGIGSSPCFELSITMKDKCGHVCIEVFMELDDDNHTNIHHCCFAIYSEIGVLEDFGKQIALLTEKQIGEKISLSKEKY